MTTHPAQDQARFTQAETALTALSALAAADAARTGPVEVEDLSGFLLSPESANRERVQLGGPRWLFPAVLGVLALFVLSCVAIYWYQGQGNKADRSVYEHTTVVTPAAAAGLTLGVGPGLQTVAQRTELAMASLGIDQPMAAGYLDSTGSSAAFVAAGKKITPPNQLVATAESLKSKFVAGADNVVPIAAISLSRTQSGPLGGVMRCGPATVPGITATYCVAVDEGSVAQFLLATGDQETAARTARGLRSAVLQRSR